MAIMRNILFLVIFFIFPPCDTQVSDLPLTAIKLSDDSRGTIWIPQLLTNYRFSGMMLTIDKYADITYTYDYKKMKDSFTLEMNEMKSALQTHPFITNGSVTQDFKNEMISLVEEITADVSELLDDSIDFEQFFFGVQKSRKRKDLSNVWNKLTCGGISGAAFSILGSSSGCEVEGIEELQNAVEANTDAIYNLTGAVKIVLSLTENNQEQIEDLRSYTIKELERSKNWTRNLITKVVEEMNKGDQMNNIRIMLLDFKSELKRNAHFFIQNQITELTKLRRMSRSKVGEIVSSSDFPVNIIEKAVAISKPKCVQNSLNCLLFTTEMKEWSPSLIRNVEVAVNSVTEQIVVTMKYPMSREANFKLMYQPEPVSIKYNKTCKVPIPEILKHTLVLEENTVTGDVQSWFILKDYLDSCAHATAAVTTCRNNIYSSASNAQWINVRVDGDLRNTSVGMFYELRSEKYCGESSLTHIGDNKYISTGTLELEVRDEHSGLTIGYLPKTQPGIYVEICCTCSATYKTNNGIQKIVPPASCKKRAYNIRLTESGISFNFKLSFDKAQNISEDRMSELNKYLDKWESETIESNKEYLNRSLELQNEFESSRNSALNSFNYTETYLNEAKRWLEQSRAESGGSSDNSDTSTIAWIALGISIGSVLLSLAILGVQLYTKRQMASQLGVKRKNNRVTIQMLYIAILFSTLAIAVDIDLPNVASDRDANVNPLPDGLKCIIPMDFTEFWSKTLISEPCNKIVLPIFIVAVCASAVVLICICRVCCCTATMKDIRTKRGYHIIVILLILMCFSASHCQSNGTLNIGEMKDLEYRVISNNMCPNRYDDTMEIYDEVINCAVEGNITLNNFDAGQTTAWALPNSNLPEGDCDRGSANCHWIGWYRSPLSLVRPELDSMIQGINRVRNDMKVNVETMDKNFGSIQTNVEKTLTTKWNFFTRCLGDAKRSRIEKRTSTKKINYKEIQILSKFDNKMILEWPKLYKTDEKIYKTTKNLCDNLKDESSQIEPRAAALPYGCVFTSDQTGTMICTAYEFLGIKDKVSGILLSYKESKLGAWLIPENWCVWNSMDLMIGCGRGSDADWVQIKQFPKILNIKDVDSEYDQDMYKNISTTNTSIKINNTVTHEEQCFPTPGCKPVYIYETIENKITIQTMNLCILILMSFICMTTSQLQVKDCNFIEALASYMYFGWIYTTATVLNVALSLAKLKTEKNYLNEKNKRRELSVEVEELQAEVLKLQRERCVEGMRMNLTDESKMSICSNLNWIMIQNFITAGIAVLTTTVSIISWMWMQIKSREVLCVKKKNVKRKSGITTIYQKTLKKTGVYRTAILLMLMVISSTIVVPKEKHVFLMGLFLPSFVSLIIFTCATRIIKRRNEKKGKNEIFRSFITVERSGKNEGLPVLHSISNISNLFNDTLTKHNFNDQDYKKEVNAFFSEKIVIEDNVHNQNLDKDYENEKNMDPVQNTFLIPDKMSIVKEEKSQNEHSFYFKSITIKKWLPTFILILMSLVINMYAQNTNMTSVTTSKETGGTNVTAIVLGVVMGLLIIGLVVVIIIVLLFCLPGGTPPPHTFILDKYSGCGSTLRNFLWSHGRSVRSYYCVGFKATFPQASGTSDSITVRICLGVSQHDNRTLASMATGTMNLKLAIMTNGSLEISTSNRGNFSITGADVVDLPIVITRSVLASKLGIPTMFDVSEVQTYATSPEGMDIIHNSNIDFEVNKKPEKKMNLAEKLKEEMKPEFDNLHDTLAQKRNYWNLYAKTQTQIRLTDKEMAMMVRWLNYVHEPHFDLSKTSHRYAAAVIMSLLRPDSESTDGNPINTDLISGLLIQTTMDKLSGDRTASIPSHNIPMYTSSTYGSGKSSCLTHENYILSMWFLILVHGVLTKYAPITDIIYMVSYILMQILMFISLNGLCETQVLIRGFLGMKPSLKNVGPFGIPRHDGNTIYHAQGYGLTHELRHEVNGPMVCMVKILMCGIGLYYMIQPCYIMMLLTIASTLCEYMCDDEIHIIPSRHWLFGHRQENARSNCTCSLLGRSHNQYVPMYTSTREMFQNTGDIGCKTHSFKRCRSFDKTCADAVILFLQSALMCDCHIANLSYNDDICTSCQLQIEQTMKASGNTIDGMKQCAKYILFGLTGNTLRRTDIHQTYYEFIAWRMFGIRFVNAVTKGRCLYTSSSFIVQRYMTGRKDMRYVQRVVMTRTGQNFIPMKKKYEDNTDLNEYHINKESSLSYLTFTDEDTTCLLRLRKALFMDKSGTIEHPRETESETDIRDLLDTLEEEEEEMYESTDEQHLRVLRDQEEEDRY